MAANSRQWTTGLAQGGVVASSKLTAIDIAAAQSVNRNSTASGYRMMPIHMVTFDPADLTYTDSDLLLQFDNLASGFATFSLDGLPNGHVLSAVRVKLMPNGIHAGAPANLPSIKVYRFDSAGVKTQLGSTATYSWVDVSTYEAGITLTVSDTAHTIDNSLYRYELYMDVENGANSITGTDLQSIQCNVTIDPSYGGPDFSHWL